MLLLVTGCVSASLGRCYQCTWYLSTFYKRCQEGRLRNTNISAIGNTTFSAVSDIDIELGIWDFHHLLLETGYVTSRDTWAAWHVLAGCSVFLSCSTHVLHCQSATYSRSVPQYIGEIDEYNQVLVCLAMC